MAFIWELGGVEFLFRVLDFNVNVLGSQISLALTELDVSGPTEFNFTALCR